MQWLYHDLASITNAQTSERKTLTLLITMYNCSKMRCTGKMVPRDENLVNAHSQHRQNFSSGPGTSSFWTVVDILVFLKTLRTTGLGVRNTLLTNHQWLRQISMKLPFAVLRKSALKFTKGSKRENLIAYYFLLFWFHQNPIPKN